MLRDHLQKASDVTVPWAELRIEAFDDYPGHDGLIAGPIEMPFATIMSDEQRVSMIWQAYSPSNGSRRPPARSRSSFRGAVLDSARREIVFESTGEHDIAVIALADRRVAYVEDQPKTPNYLDDEGNERRSTLDFILTMSSRQRIGLAVKPEAKRESSGIDDVVSAVARDNPGFVDQMLVRTEKHISRDAAFNARLILRSRRLRIEEHCNALASVAAGISGSIKVKDLLKLYRADGAGFTAAVNLIDEGVLLPATKGRITHRLLVRSADGLGEAVAPVPQPRIDDLLCVPTIL